MEANETAPYTTDPNPPQRPGGGNGMKKAAGPLAVLGGLLLKFKAAIFVAIKVLPTVLSTGGTMFLSVWAYALLWGWWFALGIVLLIFVHECGHLIAAKRLGLRVGAPVFIPFMGAVIALKEAPRNAWIEAQVGIGGPLLGTLGAAVCYAIYLSTGNTMFSALAFLGFSINLFNLAPVSPLDGGRIVTALSPWLWLIGAVIIGLLLFVKFNVVLLLICLASLPRLFSLFRRKSAEEARYFEVTPAQRWSMGVAYFGLMAFLVFGMMLTYVRTHYDH